MFFHICSLRKSTKTMRTETAKDRAHLEDEITCDEQKENVIKNEMKIIIREKNNYRLKNPTSPLKEKCDFSFSRRKKEETAERVNTNEVEPSISYEPSNSNMNSNADNTKEVAGMYAINYRIFLDASAM